MTKDQKTTAIIVTASVLFVALVAFILWRMYQKKTKSEKDDSDTTFPLQLGSRGESVKKLQEYLNDQISAIELNDNIKLTKLDEDGIFGAKTEDACLLVFGTKTVSADQYKNVK